MRQKNWIRETTKEIEKAVKYTRADARGTLIFNILRKHDPSKMYEKVLDLIAVKAMSMTATDGLIIECHGFLQGMDVYHVDDGDDVDLIDILFRAYGHKGVVAYVSWRTGVPPVERDTFWQAMEYLENASEG